MSPTSLSKFINKVFSRVIHERVIGILPNLISDHQACIKGRNIVENILLTEEIITSIRLRIKAGPNIVIKLNVKMAYDRLSQIFLTKVMRNIHFSERIISLIFGIISNNWFSVLFNEQPYDFFKSARGVKQADPLSFTLFILAAEAFSRGMEALQKNQYFKGFGMPKWSPKIVHLAYADGNLIFLSSDAISLQLVMEMLYG